MSINEQGARLGALAIEHFSQPEKNLETDAAIEKILAETNSADLANVVRKANASAGKVSIHAENDSCGRVEQVNFSFHPLFSLKTLGKDLSVSVKDLPSCKIEQGKRK